MDSLSKYIPAVYLETDKDDSLADFIDTFDASHTDLETAIESIPTVSEPRKAPLSFQQYIAKHYGSPFAFMTNERWAEGAKAENLMLIYALRGSEQGIAHAIHYLTGVQADVKQDLAYCWELDVSQLPDTDVTSSGFGTAFGTSFGS
jgi:phage tail-like protein